MTSGSRTEQLTLIQKLASTDTASVQAAGSRPRPMRRWKVVFAADEPWLGEVYETRSGRRRESFDSPEEFVRSVMRLTGWHWPPVQREPDAGCRAPAHHPSKSRRDTP